MENTLRNDSSVQATAMPIVDRRQRPERRKEARAIAFEDRRAQDWRRAADRHAHAHEGPGESTVAIFFRNEAFRIESETSESPR